MDTKRREFLKKSALVAGSAILMPELNMLQAATSPSGTFAMDSFGIQLYTLRDLMDTSAQKVIRSLSTMGYTQIESYEGKDGMFWGMGAKDFASFCRDVNIKIVASHCNIYEKFEQKVEDAASIGMSYLICPWVGPQKSMDGWKKITDKFNECGEICAKAGIKFAYHNHAYTFKAFSGMIPHEYIMDNTNPDTVFHEMDIYWVVTGGADPIGYLEKYSGRFRLCHIKDRLKDAGPEVREASCDLGTGRIDFVSILSAARKHGIEYFLMEQERYDNSTSMESAQVGADFLKQLRF